MELVGNRFLRKMVRVLVSTVVREAVPVGRRVGVGSAGAVAGSGPPRGMDLDLDLVPGGLDLCESWKGVGAVAAVAPADALVECCRQGDRTLTAPPAPPGGLCFAGVGYAGVQP